MRDSKLLRNLYLALALEGFAVLFALLLTQHDPSNAWLLGISKTRLILSAGVLAVALIFGMLFVSASRSMPWEANFRKFLMQVIRPDYGYRLILALLGVMLFAGYYLFFLSGQIGDNLVRVRLERLRPLLVWMALFAGQGLYVLPLLRYGMERKPLGFPMQLKKNVLWAFAFLTSFVLIAAVTRIGLDPDKVGWDNPGSPLLFVQLVLVIAAAGTIKYFLAKAASGQKGRAAKFNKDILISLLIWLVALVVWLPAPIQQTYFSPHPRAPNFEFYPYSDAGLHDIASQNLILGEGYAPLAEKPLYSFFLAITHLLFGQEYQVVINVQTVLLAFFPVVIFLLAARMHNRTTGIIAAGLIVVREWNTIALSPQIRVSHSKLLMTDLPAAFLISLFILALFWWLSNPGKRLYGAAFSGGSLGMVLLIRSQAIIFIPIVVLAMLLQYRSSWKAWFNQAAVFTLGVLVVITPWMVRNYQHTGIFGYAQPNQALYIAKQYSLTPEEADPGFPEETTIEEYTSLGFSKMWDFTRDYPEVVARFVASHFMRNEVSTLLIFPMSISDVAVDNGGPRFFDVDPFVWVDCCSLQASMERYPFWGDWTGTLSGENAAMMAFNLSMIAVGVAIAWRRWRFLGILPLALHFVYSFSVAIARVSGWRLILPADWIVIVYYSIGLAVVLARLAAFFFGSKLGTSEKEDGMAGFEPSGAIGGGFSRKAAVWLVLFAGLGSLVPIAEAVFPTRYEMVSTADQLHAIEEFERLLGLFPDLGDFVETDGAVAAVGRALYPRYYREGQFEPGGKWPGNVEFPAARLAFYLAGPNYSQVVLPLAEMPEYFPNAVDVALAGCRVEGHIQAFAVVVSDESGRYIYLDTSLTEASCTGTQE